MRLPQGGAMLLEALVALLVLAVGVLGIVAVQAQSIRHVEEARVRGEAVALATSLLERMAADPPAALRSSYGDPNGPGYVAFRAAVGRLPGATLPGNAPIVAVADGPSAGSTRVSVHVRWQRPGEAAPHGYGIATVVARQD